MAKTVDNGKRSDAESEPIRANEDDELTKLLAECRAKQRRRQRKAQREIMKTVDRVCARCEKWPSFKKCQKPDCLIREIAKEDSE